LLSDVTHRPAAGAGGAGGGQVKATMDGAIVDVLVADGDTVTAGETLVVLEAMKMEHPLKAGIDGVVALSCQVGQQVKSKQVLATVSGADEE
jgi:geranyl-CoA carboxylase alpha subunit